MKKRFAFLLLLVFARPALAQDMAGMDMSGGNAMPMSMTGMLGGYGMTREASGTSWQPDTAPMSGIMQMGDYGMAMFQGRLLGVLDSQSGPRGDSMAYENGMAMAMLTHPLSQDDMLGLHVMVSSDPFIGRRGYPLLLASGETANGVTPLLDRQHPHDLLMELAGSYSHFFSNSDSVFVYAGIRANRRWAPPLTCTAFQPRMIPPPDQPSLAGFHPCQFRRGDVWRRA